MRMALVLTAAGLTACATPGARPGDTSAAGHEQRAAEQQRIAAALGPGKDAEQMRFHEKMAKEHRRAASALYLAEEKACAGLSTDERAMEPIAPSRILAVAPLEASARRGDARPRFRGALVRLRAAEGEDVERLRRRIECAQAWNAVCGSDRTEARESPFAVSDVAVDVRTTSDGPVVEFRTLDPNRAEELVARFRRYASRR